MSKASLRQAGAVLRLMEEAGWKSDLVQTLVKNWGGIRGITEALHEKRLTPEQIKAVVEGRFEIVGEGVPSVVKIEDYFTSIPDSDIVAVVMECLGCSRLGAGDIGRAWRRLAPSLNYTGPVCWRVKAGFTLKRHAPKAGPCHQGFSYLHGVDFPDEPTKDQIVFWIPRLLEGSTGKTRDEQMALLADTRRRNELPDHHLTSYGSVALLAGLILAHYKATGDRAPLNQFWTRTDTCLVAGYRLNLGFGEDGLNCGRWLWLDGGRSGDLGCFPLGVES